MYEQVDRRQREYLVIGRRQTLAQRVGSDRTKRDCGRTEQSRGDG